MFNNIILITNQINTNIISLFSILRSLQDPLIPLLQKKEIITASCVHFIYKTTQ